MRHRKRTVKLGRTSAHREAMLANLVCSLIEHRRVTTTLAKAKAARPLAEEVVTLGKEGSLAARRQAVSLLRQRERVRTLFENIAPAMQNRSGGYTRIIRLGKRRGDNAELAILEWVDYQLPVEGKNKRKKQRTQFVAGAPESVEGPAGEGEPGVPGGENEAGTAATEQKKTPFWRRFRKKPVD